MHRVLLSLCCLVQFSSALADVAPTLCASNETNLFSCTLSDKKLVSLCTSKKTASDNGYVQYRFGLPGKIEVALPRKKAGLPAISLLYSKNRYLEYNRLAIENEPFTYNIESFRQFKKINRDGYPTTKSSDTLSIEDANKTVWEGNKVYTSTCNPLAASAIDARLIAKITGLKAEKAMF